MYVEEDKGYFAKWKKLILKGYTLSDSSWITCLKGRATEISEKGSGVGRNVGRGKGSLDGQVYMVAILSVYNFCSAGLLKPRISHVLGQHSAAGLQPHHLPHVLMVHEKRVQNTSIAMRAGDVAQPVKV